MLLAFFCPLIQVVLIYQIKKINLDKIDLIPIGGSIKCGGISFGVGCKVGKLPTSYLSLPLGTFHKFSRVWDAVEKRFRKRLITWKMQYLSKGGRLTLIKSTLSSLPIYFMFLFVTLRNISLRLENIETSFGEVAR